MTRTYRSELREQQAAATRARIVDATWELLRTTRPVDLSYADVAKKAGVSKRTVYRHFPAPDDLFMGVSDRLFSTLLPTGLEHWGLPEATEGFRRQLEMMEADPAVFRAFFAVPTSSRTGGAPGKRKVLEPLLERADALTEEQRTMVFALIDLASSPYVWDVLHANWGLDAKQAYRAAAFAMRAIIDRAHDHPEELELDGPPLFDWETP